MIEREPLEATVGEEMLSTGHGEAKPAGINEGLVQDPELVITTDETVIVAEALADPPLPVQVRV